MATPDRALFQPVRRSRLYEGIVRQTQDLIADKHLQPGDRLPGERELADALSVSRASVREALRVLDYIGVVEVRAGEGTFVATAPPAPMDPSVYSLLSDRTFLLDLLDARRIFEEGVVELAAENATRGDLDAIGQFLTAHEAELHGGRTDVAGDLAFHAMVAEATGNPVMLSVMRHLNVMWLQARERTGRRPTSPIKAHRFHRQILEALRRRQPAAARRALRKHLQDMRADILAELPVTRQRDNATTRKLQKRTSGGPSDGDRSAKNQNRA
ncbi:MAG: FadR family transcriptional regulator [Armatimonadetes bacterium]|nr:FadR family transcriptional regulator [Armatimonadota bacterium]